MPPDVTPLITAAKQRHELTRAKAIRAIHELDRTGAAITFGTVARAARVSRSWLYTQTDIRTRSASCAQRHDRVRGRRQCQPHNGQPQNRCASAWPSCSSASTTSSRRTNAYEINSLSPSANSEPARH